MEEDQCQLLLVTTGKNYRDFIHSIFNELHIWRMRKMYHQKEGSIRIYFCLKTRFSRICLKKDFHSDLHFLYVNQ